MHSKHLDKVTALPIWLYKYEQYRNIMLFSPLYIFRLMVGCLHIPRLRVAMMTRVPVQAPAMHQIVYLYQYTVQAPTLWSLCPLQVFQVLIMKLQIKVYIFSTPVHFAWWAHMRLFLSVSLDVLWRAFVQHLAHCAPLLELCSCKFF